MLGQMRFYVATRAGSIDPAVPEIASIVAHTIRLPEAAPGARDRRAPRGVARDTPNPAPSPDQDFRKEITSRLNTSGASRIALISALE